MSDEPADPRLLDLALRIADRNAVDWELARQTGSDLEDTLERLRQIESVARGAQAAPGVSPPPAVMFSWGPLRVVEPLGGGAFGEVFRAWDPVLEREVALKLRRPSARDAGDARWLDEARKLARVRHPHVLTVHGADVHGGRAGMWSDLVRGRDLETLLLELGPLGVREAAAVGADIASALGAVHAAGLVHGDVKARNVMREGRALSAGGAPDPGRIVLMDFGSAGESSASDGASAGTPLYAAPELLAGSRRGVASDVYALGVLLYRLVTGAFPVEAATMDELRARHARGERVSLRTRRPGLPAPFVQAVERALDPDPARRFRTAAEFEDALVSLLGASSAPPPRAPRRHIAGAVAAGAAIVLAASWLWTLGREQLRPRFDVAPTRPYVAWSRRVVSERGDINSGYAFGMTAMRNFTGDGRTIVAVSETGALGGHGQAHLYALAPDGSLAPLRDLAGPASEYGFGWPVTSGDLNGDGWPDLVVGAIGVDTTDRYGGSVYVYWGGPRFDGRPGLVLHGARTTGDFGSALAADHDLNGDGIADLVVGAPLDARAGPVTGRVFVFYGGAKMDTVPNLDLSTAITDSQFGCTIETGEDFDGDGQPDLAVSANWDNSDGPHAGRVYVYRGGPAMASTPTWVLHGKEPEAGFGGELCATGDLDGDGNGDLAVSAEFGAGVEQGSGVVYVFRGGPRPSTRPAFALPGGHEGDGFGGRRMVAADVNGDGWPDLVVPAFRAGSTDREAGSVCVYFGGPRFDERCDAVVNGTELRERFGSSLLALPAGQAGAGCDLLVGSQWHRTAGRIEGGRISEVSFRRYVIQQPRALAALPAGGSVALAWAGQERADVSVSTDAGRTWRVALRAAGGALENRATLRLPAAPAERVRFRLSPSDPSVHGSVDSSDHALVGGGR